MRYAAIALGVLMCLSTVPMMATPELGTTEQMAAHKPTKRQLRKLRKKSRKKDPEKTRERIYKAMAVQRVILYAGLAIAMLGVVVQTIFCF